jgi:hypothetical protein
MLAVVHRFRSALAVGALVTLTACASGGGGRMESGGRRTAEVVVINNSNETIFRIFMSPTRQRTWGPDQLGSGVLARGNSFRLTNITPGRWDIRIVDRSGNSKEFRNQNLRGGRSYTLNVNSSGWRTP